MNITKYNIWCEHYNLHLKRLYSILQKECRDKSIYWRDEIDFEQFKQYVYYSSDSTHLTDWT